MKNTCDQCIECPTCNVPMNKRFYDGKYMYVCPYCYLDTGTIKFSCARETDLDGLIFQLKESQTKGYLRKMYEHVITKLKENENLSTLGKTIMFNVDNISARSSMSMSRSSYISDISAQIK